MVPDHSDHPLHPVRSARERLGRLASVIPGRRVVGYLYAGYVIALFGGLFVGPVVLTAAGVAPIEALETTFVAVGAGYVVALVVILGARR
jgi:hypothetical protein